MLLTVIFLSLLLAISFFINVAGFHAARSISEASFDLAGRSVLAEYDRQLRATYGIFAFYGQDTLIISRLNDYAAYSIEDSNENKDKSHADFLRLHLKSIDVNTSAFSLLNLNIFEDQLTEQMKYRFSESITDSSRGVIAEIEQGLSLLRLVNNIAAIYEDLMKLNKTLNKIEEAAKASSDLESKLERLIQSEIDNESQDLTALSSIKVTSRELRTNIETILFNMNQIEASIRESQKLLEDIEKEIEGIELNQTQWHENDMLNKLSQIKTLVVKIINKQSQSIKTKMKANSDLLQKLEKTNPLDEESLRSFQSEYQWNVLYSIFLNLSLSDVIKEQINNDFKEKPEKLIDLNINEKIASTGRILKNSSIINELPSSKDHRNAFGGLTVLMNLNELPNFKSLINQSANTLMVNEYIGCYMNNHLTEVNDKHFFQNEMEYILFGSTNDDKNYKSVKNSILALRTGLNLVYLYQDSSKQRQISAMAVALSPGPQSLLTEFLIASAWASLEALNDLKLLEENKGVCLFKTSNQWALDLDSVFKDGLKMPIEPKEMDTQFTYTNYLKLLLLLEPREIKLLRTMDIIQINMQNNYTRKFKIRYYSCGLVYRAIIEKKSVMPSFSLMKRNIIELEGTHLY